MTTSQARRNLRSVGILVIVGSTTGGVALAQDDRSFAGAFTPEQALTLVYGGMVWESPALSGFRYSEPRAFIEPLFDAAYVEDGVEKHIVIAALTPQPPAQYFRCHACSPLLGGGVVRADGESWTLEAAGPILEFGHAWHGTHGWLDLVRVGPDRFGVLHRKSDMSGGYEDKSASLFLARDGTLEIAFEAPKVNGPGPGACGIPHEQHLRLTIDETEEPGDDVELFDVIVDAQWNDADCRMIDAETMTYDGQVCHRVTRYRYSDGAYVLSATELDECTPLPEGVRNSLRG